MVWISTWKFTPLLNGPNTYIEKYFAVKNGKFVQDISNLGVGVGGLPSDEGIRQGEGGGGESRNNAEEHTGSMTNVLSQNGGQDSALEYFMAFH